MLKQLHIKNFTLIDHLDITFEGGFSWASAPTAKPSKAAATAA